jgi:hypothetical protein
VKYVVFVVLGLFSVAFGVEEAIVVLYLRKISVDLAQYVGHLEVAREICTVVVLGTVAWLASGRPEERLRNFLIAFGAWDIAYYVALWSLSGYPRLSSQDVLFLIPIPWIGPVWAAMAFATVLMLIGFFGMAKGRGFALGAGLLLGWLSFVYGPLRTHLDIHAAGASAINSNQYPLWLFVPAIVLVAAAFPFREATASVARFLKR